MIWSSTRARTGCLLTLLVYAFTSVTTTADEPDLPSKAGHATTFELVTPKMTNESPAAGRRVRQRSPEYLGTNVYHALYLPVDWRPRGLYPVIVEYTGNKWAPCNSSGEVKDANLGYGISGGRNFIWVSMPYIESDRQNNAVTWWGDRQATIDYCKTNLPRICADFGGDPDNVIVCGFSRGAIGTSYIGLADNQIASLWKGVFTHDHFDGAKSWNYPHSDRESAIARLARLQGRPVLVCGTNATRVRDTFLNDHSALAKFSYLNVPTAEIFDIPEGPVVHQHTDLWMHKPSVAREAARTWIRDVISDGGDHFNELEASHDTTINRPRAIND